MSNGYDVIVVGGGAAGLSAALMLGRARRRTLVVDAGEPRNRYAEHMHGVLGLEGVEPGDLLRRGREEVSAYDVEVRAGRVERVEDAHHGLAVTLADGTTLRARALVAATGLRDDLPPIPGLVERWGRTVLHCPYCHGHEVRDQRLGVLTTSPLGMHQALLLRQWTDRLTVFTAGLGEMADADRDRLASRGVTLVDAPVTEVLGEGDAISGVRLADGGEVGIDAIFTAGTLVPLDGFLAPLALERTETPMGSFLAVDPTGRTSHPRVWAAGNVTNPGANVPVAIGSASMAGAMVNAMLVEEDFDAVATPADGEWDRSQQPAAFWEELYAERPRWSGRVNATVADVVTPLPVGRALDLGSGEGGDVLWLAERGWDATGVDLSPTAVERARADAAERGVAATFEAADLADPDALGSGPYDLVTASFFQSPVDLPRAEILRQAAGLLAPGGHLLMVSHAAAPPWAGEQARHHHFTSPDEDVAELGLPDSAYDVLLAETRQRAATGPDGEEGLLDDGVVLLRRRA